MESGPRRRSTRQAQKRGANESVSELHRSTSGERATDKRSVSGERAAEVSKSSEVSETTEVSKSSEVSKTTEVSKSSEVSKTTEVSAETTSVRRSSRKRSTAPDLSISSNSTGLGQEIVKSVVDQSSIAINSDDSQNSCATEVVIIKSAPTNNLDVTYSEATKRRKKRRSSFVNIVGRKSGDFLRPVNGLCESIPADLPEHERLEKLTLGALDYALMNIQHENPDLDLGSLKTKIRDVGVTVIEDLKDQGHFLKACQTRQAENPVNVQNQKIADAYEKRIATLTKESHAWDKQLEKARALCAKAQKQVDEMSSHPIHVPPRTLTQDQLTVLEELARQVEEMSSHPIHVPPRTLTEDQLAVLEELAGDREGVQADANTVRDRLVTYANRLEVCVGGLKRRHDAASSELTRLAHKLHESVKRGTVDERETISGLINVWQTPEVTS